MIRNHQTALSRAVCELAAENRWAVTGTPMQNKVMDIYAILKFLRVAPFNDLEHFRRWIDMSELGQQRLATIINTILMRQTKRGLQSKGELEALPGEMVVEEEEEGMQMIDSILSKSAKMSLQELQQLFSSN